MAGNLGYDVRFVLDATHTFDRGDLTADQLAPRHRDKPQRGIRDGRHDRRGPQRLTSGVSGTSSRSPRNATSPGPRSACTSRSRRSAARFRLLESELQTELLRRTTHRVELTEAGTLLLERAPSLLAAADEVWKAVERVGSGDTGQLQLAYGPSAGYETAPRLLRALAEALPELQIATRVLSVSAIVAAVADATIDAGIVRSPPATEGLEAQLLRRERQGVLLPQAHQLAGARSRRSSAR